MFASETAVHSGGDGSFGCEMREDWWVGAGPHGGFLAALLVRALEAGAGGDSRPLRAVTLHYLRAAAVGPARIEVDVEREGRSVTFASARLLQDDRACVLATALLADARDGLELENAEAPAVPGPDELEPAPDHPDAPRFRRKFDYRPALGGRVFEANREALTGGWLRPRPEGPLDAALVVAMCDSWFPAVYTVAQEPLAVPTLELTVHVRGRLPLPADWALIRSTTRTARDGFLEEDAELYSRDGRLLAQSRQLALSA